MTDDTQPKRSRRAEPINTHKAKNGAVSYWFQIDLGCKPDGSRDRRKFTFRTKAEARKELRRISAEVAAGTYAKPSGITVDEACDEWLAGRRGVRQVTMRGYRNDLLPARRFLGAKQLQQLTKGDGDALVTWLLTEGRQSVRHFQPDSLAGRVVALVAEHPAGITSAELSAAFAGRDIHTCMSNLVADGRITRLRRGVYGPAEPSADATVARGVAPVTVRATLTRLTAVVQSYVDQGVLPRNVIALVEPPKDIDAETDAVSATADDDEHQGDADIEPTAKSWTLAEVQQFREVARTHRLFACWLLSCYGMRRSEVLGLRWSAVDLDTGTLLVRRGRVAVGSETVEGAPKSRRSRRDLPLPADVTEALRRLKTAQLREALALGVSWSDDRLVAVREDGEPLRPEWYSDEFHRIRIRAGLRRIKLHGLRNTSGTLMLDAGHPVHVVAAWHGHDPAVLLSIYADAKADELRAASATLFG